MNPDNPCRCHRKIDFLSSRELIDPARLRFAPLNHRTHQLANQIMALQDATMMYQAAGQLEPAEDFQQRMRTIIQDIFS